MPEPVDRLRVRGVEVRESDLLMTDNEVVGDHQTGERTGKWKKEGQLEEWTRWRAKARKANPRKME